MNNFVVDQFEKIGAVDYLRREISLNSAENKIIPVTSIPSSVKSLLKNNIRIKKKYYLTIAHTAAG